MSSILEDIDVMSSYFEEADVISSSSEDTDAISSCSEHSLFRSRDEYFDLLEIPLEEIQSATNNFSHENLLKQGSSFEVYKGQLLQSRDLINIVARKSPQNSVVFNELIISKHIKHTNIIPVFKIAETEDGEQVIIINKHQANGSLDKHLSGPTLTWLQRLNICVGVAHALNYLHYDADDDHHYIHGNIKSSKILLDHNWEPKLHGFGFAVKAEKHHLHLTSNYDGTLQYMDPAYENTRGLTHKSDVFSFGVMLSEVLFGREAIIQNNDNWYFARLATSHYEERKLDYLIDPYLQKQMNLQSFNIFAETIYYCLREQRSQRPDMIQVLSKLEKALELQHKHEHPTTVAVENTSSNPLKEDYEVWEPKLPIDYKKIFRMSEYSKINSIRNKKDLYDAFSKGILLQDCKVLFSLGGNGERNEMISARMFSYKNSSSYRWQSVKDSRFYKVAEMFDISKLNIKIKVKTQFLSPSVNYGAYVIFKFCDTRKFSSKPIYVNLKYKMGGENLHAYFATWREDNWMMIELCRFLSDKKDTKFGVLLESFSQYYCGNGPIYIDGLEFRVIDNVKNEKIKEVQQILKSDPDKDQLLSLKEVNRKKHLMLSPMEVLYDASIVKHFYLQLSAESRFYNVIELLPHQVFRIHCKIQSQILSPDTEYLCYLVFRLSKNCLGLHCPVKVRDLLHRNNKQAEIIYFRTPSPWNLHENISVPEQTEDRCMEVKIWKFNSNHQLKNGCIPVNLKLITCEGNMSGLILCGLDFRPI